MVWEDKLADRELDVEYTNDNDVPLYVQLYFTTKQATGTFLIDGVGVAEGETTDNGTCYHSPMYIVPSKSTYKFKKGGAGGGVPSVSVWQEAKMPVAVGTGGKTVAFRGELSAKQTGLTSDVWTKVNLDTATIDTDSAFSDGKFNPSIAGYYQVNGSVRSDCSPRATQTIVQIIKNGSRVAHGSNVVAEG